MFGRRLPRLPRPHRLWLVLLTLLGAAVAQARPTAVAGVLDLRGTDFSQAGTLRLDGQWDFYWQQLLEPAELAAAPPRDGLFLMPGVWNGMQVGQEQLAWEGFATLRLQLLLPEGDRPYALRLATFYSAYKLWIDGQKVAEEGGVGTTRETHQPQQYIPRIVRFRPAAKSVTLVLQISNFTHRKGGVRESITLGLEPSIERASQLQLAFDLFVFGATLLMGVYHLGLYLLRRKDRSTLWFALFSFCLSMRTLFTGEYFLVSLFPTIPWELHRKVEYAVTFASVPTLVLFLNAVFPETRSRWMEKATVWGFAFLSLCVALFPIRHYARLFIVFELGVAVSLSYSLWVLYLACTRRRPGAYFLLGGFALFIPIVALEMARYNGLVQSPVVAPFGMLLLCTSQALLLARRFTGAFETVEGLSENLRSYSKELEQKNASLKEVDRLKDEFLANTSHELRTPLHGIIGIAESLLDGASGTLSVTTRRNLSLIVGSGQRLAGLVNDVLDFSKLRHQDLQLQRRPVDLRGAAQVVLEVLRPLVGARSLELENRIPADLPCAWADERRVEQVLHNLVGNAIKFTESGTVVLTASRRGELLEVAVTDTGIGIASDQLERVFEAFEQADGSISRNYGGTGLGLSISRKLVELHGGTLCLRSKFGEGSTFSFTLPVAKAQAQDSPLPAAPAPESASRPVVPEELGGEPPKLQDPEFTLLAVDDEPINLAVLANQLGLHNYQVVKAASGPEALGLLATGRAFDLMLLDVMMPGMSGFEVARTVRERFHSVELPILMLTAKNQVVDVIAGFESGANDYLSKPFDKRELQARVDALLALRRSIREKNELLAKLEHLNANLESLVAQKTGEIVEKNRLVEEEMAKVARANQELRVLNDRLEEVSRTDPLTGLSNRRDVSERLKLETTRIERYGGALSVLILDLDHFKAINDTYGHNAGDQVLRHCVEVFRGSLRKLDALARWGGEEFLVVLPDTNGSGAAVVAEKLRMSLASSPAQFGQYSIPVTVSIGVTEYRKGTAIDQCVHLADQCLYEAKKLGRNRVIGPERL